MSNVLRVHVLSFQGLRSIPLYTQRSKDVVLGSYTISKLVQRHRSYISHEYSLSRIFKRKLSSQANEIEFQASNEYQETKEFKMNRIRTSSLQRITFPLNSNLFQRVDILLSVPLGQLHPLDVKYTAMHILKDCCKLNTMIGMEKSLLILNRLLREKRRKNESVLSEPQGDNSAQRMIVIPRYTFHIVMYGFVQLASKNKKAIGQCNDLLQRMWDEYSYDTQYQDLFQQKMGENIDSLQNISSSSCRPTVHDYNTLLTAHAYGTKWDPQNLPKEAEKIVLSTMISLSQTYPDLFPDLTSFHQLIKCHSNSGTYNSGQSAQSILEKMQEYKIYPDVKSYTGVISAFAHSNGKQSSAHAEKILFEFINKVQSKSLINQNFTQATSEDVFKHDDNEEEGPTISNQAVRKVEPDHILFTSCIQGWVNAAKHYGRSPKARFEAAQHAEKILNVMYELAATWEKDALQFGQAHLLASSSSLPKDSSPQRNPYIPDLITWNTVLTGWAKSDIKEAAPRAQQLLDELIHLAQKDVLNESGLSIRPDRTSFHIVMDAWARYSKYDSDSVVKVEHLMNQMYDLYHSGRFKDNIKPNAMTYILAMKAWARSESKRNPTNTPLDIPFKVQKCQDLLDSMISKYDGGEKDMLPNIVAYTTILNAIVHAPPIDIPAGPESPIISIAMKTYRDIMQDSNDYGLKPDDIVFATMLQVVRTHLDKSEDARRLYTEQVFDDACHAGFVSTTVLRELSLTCPSSDLLERLMGKSKSDVSDSLKHLPKEWTNNIRQAIPKHTSSKYS